MKANEFIKMVGFKSAKMFLERNRFDMVQIKSGFKRDLKRLVESYELVERFKCKRYSGISNAKDHLLTLAHIEDYEKLNKLRQAILDVESCQ